MLQPVVVSCQCIPPHDSFMCGGWVCLQAHAGAVFEIREAVAKSDADLKFQFTQETVSDSPVHVHSSFQLCAHRIMS
jgi:hypothetical protein